MQNTGTVAKVGEGKRLKVPSGGVNVTGNGRITDNTQDLEGREWSAC